MNKEKIEDIYKTFSVVSEGYFIEKGSKFYSYAYPISSETEAKQFITELKTKYYDANHCCYSYKTGLMKGQEIFRFNDDGEPAGSAGKPIYRQILSNDLSNVLIIVIRYFGGTKLGISGLIEAYKTAAKKAINNNVIIEKFIFTRCMLKYNYEDIGKVMRILKEENIKVLNQEYDTNRKILTSIEVRQSYSKYLRNKMSTIYPIEFSDIAFIVDFK